MKRVLVVDDDKDILTVVKILLSMHGFNVEAIARWEEIFAKTESFRPDIILLDVALGGQDGRVLCKQLKTAEKTKKIPIVLFSANHGILETYSEYLADDFIAKPFDIDNLLDKLKMYMPSKN
jgi:DNA-binding response OmpR family regulator